MRTVEVRDPGDPVKYTAERRELFLEKVREGLGLGAAARAVGVMPVTERHWRRVDPEYAQQVLEAEIEGCEEVESALRMAALEGNVTAALVWLYNRSDGRWVDKRRPDRVEVHQVIEIEAGERLAGIRALEARLSERQALRSASALEQPALEAIEDADIVEDSSKK
jgi:hypothetical protein